MHQTLVKPVSIVRVENNQATKVEDLLATEEPLEIRMGYGEQNNRMQKSISVTMRTPGNDFELALGFLFTEGIIESADQIHQIKYCTELNSIENKENIVRVELKTNVNIDFSALNRNFYTTSSCGICGKESIESVKTVCRFINTGMDFNISGDLLNTLSAKLRKEQSVFEYTGGIHASALFDEQGNLLLLREDVGRHNALDKLIGAVAGSYLFSNKSNLTIPLTKYILLLSGRASFELIQKAAMAGITLVCAVGAPSSLAVQMADSLGITLVGFLRDNRFNIYTHPNRISSLPQKAG